MWVNWQCNWQEKKKKRQWIIALEELYTTCLFATFAGITSLYIIIFLALISFEASAFVSICILFTDCKGVTVVLASHLVGLWERHMQECI